MTRRFLTRSVRTALVTLALLLPLLVLSAAAQPARPTETFDLVLYGEQLNDVSEHVQLKSNPWRRDAWIAVGQRHRTACTGSSSVYVLRALPTGEYLGQDVRENYIALKIAGLQSQEALRAAYALPLADPLDEDACQRIAHLVATDPATVRHLSLASHVRPRPVSLSGPEPFIEHLEAPVRHRKPGVMEVEWLEILFNPDI